MENGPQIDILVPYATKNYIKNPSFEDTNSGWNAVGASISLSILRARYDRFSLRVATNNAAVQEGVYYRINDTSLIGSVWGSVAIRGRGTVRLRLISGASQSVSEPMSLHDNYWQYMSVRGTALGNDDFRIYIETYPTSNSAVFFLDGVQVEQGNYLTTFCDGRQPDCRWNGVSDASTSERPGNSPNGGRWVNVRDDECDPTTYITTFSGMGLPPITINRQRMALSPGAFFDSQRVEERVIQFTVNIKDSYAQHRTGNSKVRLNELRQFLIDLIKPDREPNTEPMWMRYRDGDRSLLIRVLYESGLEFDGDFRNKWINSIPLRFLALDPFWYEDSQEVARLDTETTHPEVFLLAHREDKEWHNVAQGIGDTAGNQYITDIIETPDGQIYIAGSFAQDGDGNNLRNFARLSDDYSELIEVGTGFNSLINSMVAHPNGLIYIAGTFTQDGAGNPYNRIVAYDPSTDTFSALGNGVNDFINDMSVDKNGNLYAVGNFTTAGVVNANKIAMWDGGAWTPVGDISADLAGIDIPSTTPSSIVAVDTDEIYMCGAFVNGVGTQLFSCVKYNGTTWSDMNNSASAFLSAAPNYMRQDIDGTIIILAYNYMQRWNGSSYETLGTNFSGGLLSQKYRFAIASNGVIYVTGYFVSNGDIDLDDGVAVWNGSSWSKSDFVTNYPGRGILARKNGDIFLGLQQDGAVAGASSPGFINFRSKSTAVTYPVFTFEGSQEIVALLNNTTNQYVYLQYNMNADEIVELDFRTGAKTIQSNYRANISYALLPNSSDLFLLPADIDGNKVNRIGCLVINETSPRAQIRYQPTHWSVDAISKQ